MFIRPKLADLHCVYLAQLRHSLVWFSAVLFAEYSLGSVRGGVSAVQDAVYHSVTPKLSIDATFNYGGPMSLAFLPGDSWVDYLGGMVGRWNQFCFPGGCCGGEPENPNGCRSAFAEMPVRGGFRRRAGSLPLRRLEPASYGNQILVALMGGRFVGTFEVCGPRQLRASHLPRPLRLTNSPHRFLCGSKATEPFPSSICLPCPRLPIFSSDPRQLEIDQSH
ncbi:hypothetical protein BJ322DRAFT_409075 [Thelephora terrestris]|uniref:Uncharacterized protein n=1 Tax=Thelephora terrestris TaxID=56493 RepID=A0A9P6LBB8_9AGAM|nr:hypothetical protein BJ322DRAFT_409075 [Thelephora terrestris]